MKKFFLYFLGFVIVFFIAPAICTVTPSKAQEVVETANSPNNQEETQENNVVEPTTTNAEENKNDNNSRTIKLLHSTTGQIEEIDLDEYLYGVVSSEMPANFEIEALKAQAVVARTYTIYQITHNSSKHPEADICDNYACCQAWISKEDRLSKWKVEEAESNWNKITEAVNLTKGKIITYNGEPINAFFHSNSGGVTESSVNIWGGIDYPYLKSVETSGEDGYTQYSSQVQISKQDLLNKIKEKYPDCEIDFSQSDCIEIKELTTSEELKQLSLEIKKLLVLKQDQY